jgi:hypothetical protein
MEIPKWSFMAVGQYLFNKSVCQLQSSSVEIKNAELEESDLCILDILYSGWIEQIHQIFI